MNLKHNIEEAIAACDRAADGKETEKAFAALAQVLRTGWAEPAFVEPGEYTAEARRLHSLLTVQSSKVLDLQTQITNERTAAHCEIQALKFKYDESDARVRKLLSEAVDARAVLAKVLDRPMAQVKLSDVNDLALELNAEHERAETAETARDASFLRTCALEQALLLCNKLCDEPIEDLPQHAQAIIAWRIRGIVAEILVSGTKNEQARST